MLLEVPLLNLGRVWFFPQKWFFPARASQVSSCVTPTTGCKIKDEKIYLSEAIFSTSQLVSLQPWVLGSRSCRAVFGLRCYISRRRRVQESQATCPRMVTTLILYVPGGLPRLASFPTPNFSKCSTIELIESPSLCACDGLSYGICELRYWGVQISILNPQQNLRKTMNQCLETQLCDDVWLCDCVFVRCRVADLEEPPCSLVAQLPWLDQKKSTYGDFIAPMLYAHPCPLSCFPAIMPRKRAGQSHPAGSLSISFFRAGRRSWCGIWRSWW